MEKCDHTLLSGIFQTLKLWFRIMTRWKIEYYTCSECGRIEQVE